MASLLITRALNSGDNRELQFEDLSVNVGGSYERSKKTTDGNNSDDDGQWEEAKEKDGENEEGDDSNANAGWAEAMAKILGKKTPVSKTSILVKNKDINRIKEKERQDQLDRKKQVDKKRAWEMICRKKPDIVKDRETERALQRIATRGVVQLFNAVRTHQTTINDKVKEVGGSDTKRAKFLLSVSKKDFIDVLRKTDGGSGVNRKTEKDAVVEEKPAWSVLRDDFMMGATMKDWDKEGDREEPSTNLGRGLEKSDID